MDVDEKLMKLTSLTVSLLEKAASFQLKKSYRLLGEVVLISKLPVLIAVIGGKENENITCKVVK